LKAKTEYLIEKAQFDVGCVVTNISSLFLFPFPSASYSQWICVDDFGYRYHKYTHSFRNYPNVWKFL